MSFFHRKYKENINLPGSLDKLLEESSFDQNIQLIKDTYHSTINKDFVCREFTMKQSSKKAILFFYKSAVNSQQIEDSIIHPLQTIEGTEIQSIASVFTVATVRYLDELVGKLNECDVILLIDGYKEAYTFSISQFQHRAIEKPANEGLIKGPKEAFTESLQVNHSLLRKRIYNENFVAESISIGKRSKSNVSIMYIKNLANEEVLKKVRDRLANINVDNVRTVELLEQYIEDRVYSVVPTLLYTERPDRAAAHIDDGYVVLMMENSSACLILPVTFWSFFHAPEDHYLRLLFGNFTRLIRMAAFFITLFISSLYIAVTNYHSEMLPPDLLFAIAASRERVPFPVVFEVLLMEFAFELIREAGLRIPSPLGPTIGIVGALILGQAAVEANIISPIIVIVAALSGLSSFAITDVSFNFTLRISRFIFIFSATIFGIYGLTACFLLWLMYLTSVTSFGVPYLAPLGPKYISSKDTLFRGALHKERWRPEHLKPKDLKKNATRR
ncbi:spore germination protein [Bacillus suaedae]|uniref:Spore germination protein n=1 Tax=Halalkalibacter suaedae TaxID=2822140 RepID=A0A941AT24_9BACI|nr:spore germination protein [Bacillus suaedae]MBP3950684.1 spore germination protein [Bacillus suaedae]